MRIAINGAEKTVPFYIGMPLMIKEIYKSYYLPMKPCELKLYEVKFWYEPLIPELLKMQKASKNRKNRR